jgi:Putative prokaryotic signal transducing protein
MEFIQVRSFDNYVYAHIRMGMLQEAGINCHLQDEYTITVDPFLSPAIGGMKLMVYPTQAQRATQLLAETDRNE